ncbi:hypothetical protein [Morganella morganii]
MLPFPAAQQAEALKRSVFDTLVKLYGDNK